ncbi:MAG: DUF6544 family protein [Terracoccus sp.]
MSAVRPGRRALRRIVGAVVIAHGLLHLLGAATGRGWFAVPALSGPIGSEARVVWLVAAVLVVAAGVLLASSAPRWWVVSALAAVVSQAVIVWSWSDAAAGTVVNVVLVVAALYGWAAEGRHSLGAEYRRRAAVALATPPPAAPERCGPVVTEYDLAVLPASVAAYLRRAGSLGQPRVTSFRAHLHGRIRASATSTWMPFTGEQVNTYGPSSCRLFSMDASLRGMPLDVLHVFVGSAASMRVRAVSLVPMVDAVGPQMARSETVTLFNDLCVLAPAALVDADVEWTVLGPDRVHGDFTRGSQTVGADLVFDDREELVDFVSEDRLAASPDGKVFTARRWSTPLGDYRDADHRRRPTRGDARWGGTPPDASFTYLELTVDDVEYNVHEPPAPALAGAGRRRPLPERTAASTMSSVWQAPMHFVVDTVQAGLARHYVGR